MFGLFILYYMVKEGLEMRKSGIREYFHEHWNVVDLIAIIGYILNLAVWIWLVAGHADKR